MNRGRREKFQDKGIDNKTAVMGMAQRQESVIVERPNKIFPDKIVKEKVVLNPGKVNLTIIGANTFKDVVRQNVGTSAIVVTDTHLSYVGLSQEYAAHLSVNHSQSHYRDGVAFTNTVEGFFSSLKRSIYVFIIV
jgi:ISXO2-like transposase domain